MDYYSFSDPSRMEFRLIHCMGHQNRFPPRYPHNITPNFVFNLKPNWHIGFCCCFVFLCYKLSLHLAKIVNSESPENRGTVLFDPDLKQMSTD